LCGVFVGWGFLVFVCFVWVCVCVGVSFQFSSALELRYRHSLPNAYRGYAR
jgi:hypothetical protein